MSLARGIALAALLACLAASVPPARADDEARARTALASLSLEDKVGQVLMITVGAGARVSPVTRRFLETVRPGGITLFRYHLRALGAVAAFADALRNSVPAAAPFIAVDQEGGKVARLGAGVPRVPSSLELGRSGSAATAERAGNTVARAMRRLGFDLNLAPVLDVPRSGGGRHVVARAFGASPERVAMLGAAYVRGLQAGGVGAVGKHFPGEGASRGDPHRGLPTAPVTRAVLQAQDVVPFRDCGADAIMMSHVRFPALGEGPASLSPATYELLRGAAGFTGVAMTDGLEMKSIRQRYGLGPAAVLALRAGADMVSVFWSPAKVREAYGAVLSAARSGALSLARLDEAVLRVLRAKLRRGVRVGTPVRGAAASVSAGAAE